MRGVTFHFYHDLPFVVSQHPARGGHLHAIHPKYTVTPFVKREPSIRVTGSRLSFTFERETSAKD